MVYLQGEIDVSSAGTVDDPARFGRGNALWVDDQPVPAGLAGASPARWRPAGTRSRFESTPQPAVDTEIKVEVKKPSGSTAEFTVVGGR